MSVPAIARTLILSMALTIALFLLIGIEQALGDRLMAITVGLVALVALAGFCGPLIQFSPRHNARRMRN